MIHLKGWLIFKVIFEVSVVPGEPNLPLVLNSNIYRPKKKQE